jgi:hypothetical protein
VDAVLYSIGYPGGFASCSQYHHHRPLLPIPCKECMPFGISTFPNLSGRGQGDRWEEGEWYHIGSAVFGHVPGPVHQGEAYCLAWCCRGNIIHWYVPIVHLYVYLYAPVQRMYPLYLDILFLLFGASLAVLFRYWRNIERERHYSNKNGLEGQVPLRILFILSLH